MDVEAELNPVSRAVLQHVERHGRRGLIAAVVVASMSIVLAGCVWGMWIAGTPRDHWWAAITTAMIITFACALMVASPIVDISAALGSALDEMERRASIDALTGALRRDAFAERAAALDAERSRSVAMVDADRFKLINDAHGHAAGDAVLVAIVELIRDGRPDAIVGRLGGDEFAVAAPCRAVDLAEWLEAALASVVSDRGHSVSCSVGATDWEPGHTIDQALLVADRHLLARKSDRSLPQTR